MLELLLHLLLDSQVFFRLPELLSGFRDFLAFLDPFEMVGNGFQRFREFSLLVRCLVQVFVLRSAVGRLERLINGIDRSVLLVLYQCGGIVGIPRDFPAFVIQDVLYVGFLSEGGIK